MSCILTDPSKLAVDCCCATAILGEFVLLPNRYKITDLLLFDGVWGQAARGASGQQAIIRAIAPHPQGLTMDALADCTGSDMTTLQEALKILKRHDVVQETDGSLRIMVELFRRWVLLP